MTTDALKLLAGLLRARRFDEHLLTVADDIDGHWHSSIGMEATGAALGLLREPDDLVMTTYRNHAHLAASGADLAVMYAEILGRDLGPQRGRSGSFHLIAPAQGIVHTSAMVSAGLPLACGLALGLQRRGEGMVFCFFGDGALNEGGSHEALNLAALWQLPVLFVCENNAAPTEGQANDVQAAPTLGALAEANAIPATSCDGRHPHEVTETLRTGQDEVRESGPRFVEVRTPVWPGNRAFFPFDATGPTQLARATQTTEEEWYAIDDPVLNECRRLLAEGAAMGALEALDQEITAEVAGALERGRSAQRPPPDVAMQDVLAARGTS